MIKSKNKRLEITLTSDEMDLLNSLSLRFNISKSTVIKQALKVFASKRKHYLTISYKEVNSQEQTPGMIKSEAREDHTVSDEEWNEMFKDFKNESKD